MPWEETCAVDQRMRFVTDVEGGQCSKARLCRQYGISRPTGEKWLKRYAEYGVEGLKDRSRAPRQHPNAVSPDLVEALVAFRGEHPWWGPKKIRAYLMGHQPHRRWPASSTIGEILTRYGLTVARKRRHRLPPHTAPFADCDGPNSVWTADFKGWFRTGDGTRCDPLTISDAYSRYLLRCQGLSRPDFTRAKALFQAAFCEYGLPRAIRTDNGPPFVTTTVGGLSRLSVWWIKLGIVPERIEPGQPQQNGRHERLHLTLKQAVPVARTLRGQQRAFDRFLREYNEQRPHEALGQRPPASVYVASPRPYPARAPAVRYPEPMTVRVVQKDGCFHWRGRHIFLSEVLRGEPVGLEPVDDGQWRVHFGPVFLARFDAHQQTILKPGSVGRRRRARTSRRPFRSAPGPPGGPSNV